MIRMTLVPVALVLAIAAPARAAEVLFPSPLHLTRAIDDPISRSRTVVEEYYQGNRVVAIRGERTSIADYEKGELTEIDRARGTYSITKFETIAKAHQGASMVNAKGEGAKEIDVRAVGSDSRASRAVELFEARANAGGIERWIRVAVDRDLTLSREALDVVIGAAYPNRRTDEHDVVLAAARPAESSIRIMGAGGSRFRLPLEHDVEFDVDGERLHFRNSVTRIGSEIPPPDLISIPAGARRIESETFSIDERLREIDELPRRTP